MTRLLDHVPLTQTWPHQVFGWKFPNGTWLGVSRPCTWGEAIIEYGVKYSQMLTPDVLSSLTRSV